MPVFCCEYSDLKDSLAECSSKLSAHESRTDKEQEECDCNESKIEDKPALELVYSFAAVWIS